MANNTRVAIEEIQINMQALRAETERLRREHIELKARLSELNSRLYLSPAEELEKKTLQKLKLAKKDRLAALDIASDGMH